MSHFHRLRFIVALCATLVAASCASPDPKLYTIAPVPGTELSGGPKVVALHGVGVAQYLLRSPIVQSSADYRVVLMANEWWGEPIDAMLGRVLVEDLTQRLPQSTIYSSASAVTGSPEATIEIEVQRLDLDREGHLVLIAQGSVSFKNRESADTRSFRISQPLPSPGVEGQVAATSTALAQVADRIAAMRRRRTWSQMTPPQAAQEPEVRVEAALRECPGCGLFQIEPALSPGMTALCERCGTTLRRTRRASA